MQLLHFVIAWNMFSSNAMPEFQSVDTTVTAI